MRKIRLIAVGKLKESWWQEAQAEYAKRLSPYAKINVVEVQAEAASKTVTPVQAMEREGGRIMKALPEAATIILVDRIGEKGSSEALAKRLASLSQSGNELVFVIGGAHGFDPALRQRANMAVSLSDLTFTHEMARIILLEQLYRAETILAGKEYHY